MPPKNQIGWETSAAAWISRTGDEGDFGRRYVLDRPMLSRTLKMDIKTALDVGCGEGRFSRKLRDHGIEATGIDLSRSLIDEARKRDPAGRYLVSAAEALPFKDQSFPCVIAYLSLIDIEDYSRGLSEIARVLDHGGKLLIANLTGFNTAGDELGWQRDWAGNKKYFRIDDYLRERGNVLEFDGLKIINYHRPLSAYMRVLLDLGLRLTYFDEPFPIEGAPEPRARDYVRAPWFLIMEWAKP